jgi:hypothetical protein
MRWLGRIDTGVNLHVSPVLIPNYRNGQDWVLWYRRYQDSVDWTEYSVVHFDSLTVDTVDAIWTKRATQRGSFIPNRVTVSDINGDGRSEIFGSETHYIRSTPTGHVIDSVEVGVLGGDFGADFDGDGYGEVGGSHIFWGDSTVSLSERSIVAWQTGLPAMPAWASSRGTYPFGTFGAQGSVFTLVKTVFRNDPHPNDTTSRITMTVQRLMRLRADDIASHADTVRVDTTWTPQDFVHITQQASGSNHVRHVGYQWPSLELAYHRNGRFILESGGPGSSGYAMRCVVDSLGMTCDTTTRSDTSWGTIGISSGTYINDPLEPDDYGGGSIGSTTVRMIHAFPHPDSLFLSIQKVIDFPDSLDAIARERPGGGLFRFPDITGDGRRELALVYEHVTLGPVIDIFDIWGAVVTGTGGGGGAVRGSIEPTVSEGRLRWSGGSDGPTVVRLYDTAGRLLRSTTIDGLELAIRGVDCTGLQGPVAVSFTTAQGTTSHTVLVEAP